MTVLPAFLDAHVHLTLIDPATLLSGGIGRVLDLGGLPAASAIDLPEAAYAHQFLTAPGGYPTQQSWTPPGSVCPVATRADAAAAVDRQADAGASVVKVTLNSVAGPVLADDVLVAILTRARERRLPVVVHAEGAGQAERAFTAGADMFAHTPFSERLDDGLIVAMAGRMTWISTLDIHGWGARNDDFARACDNLRRFHAAGGRVLYGTDLGNGPLPVGLNRREIEGLLHAGLSPDAVITSLIGTAGLAWTQDRVTVIPGARPTDPAGFVDWLCTARAVAATDVKEDA
ncbi:amidohydrolase family protein [Cryobacterium sp. MLB-32]|uniref:amidohydrolase family protein n=1 Tax=Cryobacterium sp. MLB-32 TaxID=1529318 RepID=UPI00068B6E1E|nr:amidohydrolase family protein [Cryobacterium sp. MLB-32]